MAKLRRVPPPAVVPTASSKTVGPMSQGDATRAAYAHPAVVAAEQREHAFLRSLGVRHPRDPRWILHHRLSSESSRRHAEFAQAELRIFRRVRTMLIEGTTEGALAALQ